MDRLRKRDSLKTGYLLCFILGVCIGGALLWGISMQRGRTEAAMLESIEPMEPEKAQMPEPGDAGTVVDYPFFSGEEGWMLVLQNSSEGDAHGVDLEERKFCLYDEKGQLLQEFPCGIAAAEFVFRFDSLSPYYGYGDDLIVFPAGAQEKGEEGLCYLWDYKEKRFTEEPVSIPWYQEDSVKNQAFMTDKAEENGETNVICRINGGSREVVELRKWTLHRDEETGEEILHIWDCLEQQDIYFGKVERYETGALINEEYYQYLFWDGLKIFGSQENDGPIRIQKEVQGTGLAEAEYEDRKAFLADYGFAQAEPYYEYYDRFHNLIMELYFDPQAGRGCGICYYYSYNDNLDKRASREGFVFDEVKSGIWEPQDTFSTLPVSGKDASAYASGYREIYEYTDDGCLSSFEARGMMMCEHEPMEVSLLSVEYIYRNDGTLCHKQYHHWPMAFGTTGQAQSGDYDEQGRLVFWYGYITHGAMEKYYIYEEGGLEPAYCLEFDHGGSPPVMVAYDRGN